MKKLPVLIFILLCSLLNAETYQLIFVDGFIEYNDGSGWEDIYIGDYIPDNAEIKIFNDTYAEITSGSIKITLSTEGVFSINNLFKTSQSVASWNFSSIIGSKVSKLSGLSEENEETTAMGVRGALLTITETEWMDDEEKSLNDAKKLIAQEDYITALEVLLDISTYAYGSILDEVNFFIGYLYNELNNYSLSLKYLNLVPHDAYADYFPELVLLKSSLLINSLSFDEALELLDLYSGHYPKGAKLQSVLYLSAVCLFEQGKTGQCRTSLEKAVSINPYSDIGKSAAVKLSEL